MNEQKVRLVLTDEMDCSGGPDLVTEQNVRFREVFKIGSSDDPFSNHLLFNGSLWSCPFVECPRDGGGPVDRHPINLCGSEPGFVRSVVDGRHMYHLLL